MRELSEIEKKTYDFIKDAGEIQTSNIHDNRMCGAVSSLKNMGLVEVFKKYREGCEKAVKIINKAARIFARGLVNITSILDTKLIILGGSVTNDWDILKPLVTDEFYRSFPPLTKGVEIKLSGLKRYLGDLAALSLVMPKNWIKVWKKEHVNLLLKLSGCHQNYLILLRELL